MKKCICGSVQFTYNSLCLACGLDYQKLEERRKANSEALQALKDK